jgi:putative Mg2+ transporter-C (MgtC) family protein
MPFAKAPSSKPEFIMDDFLGFIFQKAPLGETSWSRLDAAPDFLLGVAAASRVPEIPGYVSLASLTLLDVVGRLFAAFVLGGALGYNRERLGKPAGLRTHIMVTLGSCAFLILGVEVLASYGQAYDTHPDPTKVLEGVVGGIGFLGAGSIIQSKGTVEGVTTAATVWVAGAVGAGCGLGLYQLTAILVCFSLVALWVLGLLEVDSSDAKASPSPKEDPVQSDDVH